MWTLSAFSDEAGDPASVQIQALKRDGYKFIDIRGIDGFNITTLPLDKAKAIRAQLDDAGIKVNMFGSPIGKIDLADDFQIDLDKLSHLGQLKNILDCNAVRMFSYYNKKKNAPADVFEKEAMDRLKKLRDHAAKLGLVLYHENESGIYGDTLAHNLNIAKHLRDANGKGTFRIIFDFDNFNHVGEDVWNCWEKLHSYVDAIHLKDSDKNKQHVPVGQGAGQIPKILKDALARKWAGPLILEPHLAHSAAVQATNVSGQENKQYKELPQVEIFHVAASAAVKLLGDIGAKLV